MGQLKRDHSGYRTSGLWKKYQQVIGVIPEPKHKSKKDTLKWCRGKRGVEHEWHRFQSKRYDWEIDDYVDPYIRTKCVECGKSAYKRIAKTSSMPLHAFIYDDHNERVQIQVRVNGNIIPFTETYRGKWWCLSCRQFHTDR